MVDALQSITYGLGNTNPIFVGFVEDMRQWTLDMSGINSIDLKQ